MHKEMLRAGGNNVATIFHPDKRTHVAPTIDREFTRDGTRYYKDTVGKDHVADTFDRVFGKRDSNKIIARPKREYQRTFKTSRK